VEIARAADTTLVVEAPGLGDEVQAIKAGILEIADIVIVNKADREGAANTVRALQAILDLNTGTHTVSHHGVTMATDSGRQTADSIPAWRPPVLQTIALEGQGISQVQEAIARHQTYLIESGEAQKRRRARIASELEAIVHEKLLRRWLASLSQANLSEMVERIAARELDPYTAAERLLGNMNG